MAFGVLHRTCLYWLLHVACMVLGRLCADFPDLVTWFCKASQQSLRRSCQRSLNAVAKDRIVIPRHRMSTYSTFPQLTIPISSVKRTTVHPSQQYSPTTRHNKFKPQDHRSANLTSTKPSQLQTHQEHRIPWPKNRPTERVLTVNSGAKPQSTPGLASNTGNSVRSLSAYRP